MTLTDKFKKEVEERLCMWKFVINQADSTSKKDMEKRKDYNLNCSCCFGYKDSCQSYVSMKQFWREL